MTAHTARLGALLVSVFTVSAVALAERASPGPPLVNWHAPATYTPSTSSSRIRALSDISNPVPFIGVTPCRIVDTRGPAGTFGGPSLPASMPRNFPLPTGPCTGIPASVSAYSLNITVTNTQGPGFISIYPQGGAAPLVSTLNYLANQTLANAAIVPAGTSGGVTVVAGVSGTDLIIDINGYYGPTPSTAADPFTVSNTSGTSAIIGRNASTSNGAAGVLGQALGTIGVNYGVLGQSASTSFGAAGVHGEGSGGGQTIGVEGVCNGGSPTSLCTGMAGRGRATGGYFTSDGTAGVGLYGLAFGTSGLEFGVFGSEASLGFGSAGVKGVDYSGSPASLGFAPAGVRGESKNGYGVLGLSQILGIAGRLLDSSGMIASAGYLGYDTAVGVFYSNGLAGTGTKSFIEPHPTDATKLIKYVSIEGPEAGVYFRGRGQAHKGLATIEVPENFRMVASEEGLSIQVTPIGETANVAVLQIDLNRIVVKATRDVEFFYTVNGVRRAYPTWNPIQENRKEFVPEGPDAKLPIYLSANETQRLIDNGTYNADGTVNMSTAERAGWVKAWADREAEAQAAAREAQKAASARQR
jgi:hypothetical protein